MDLPEDRTFFVTSVTWGRRPLFRAEPLAARLVETLFTRRDEGCYALHEFVVMPDHFHLLVTPRATLSLERVMQLVKGGFSYELRKQRPAMMIWEKSFTNHRIRNAEDYSEHARYIHFNPVRAGLVPSPGGYRFCSPCPGYRLDEPPQGLKPNLLSAGLSRG